MQSQQLQHCLIVLQQAEQCLNVSASLSQQAQNCVNVCVGTSLNLPVLDLLSLAAGDEAFHLAGPVDHTLL